MDLNIALVIWEAEHHNVIVVFFFLFSSFLVLDQLPFMMMPHPLIPASLAPASVSMAMGQMNRLSTLASIANVAQLHANPPARAPNSVIKVNPVAPQPHRSDYLIIKKSFKSVKFRNPESVYQDIHIFRYIWCADENYNPPNKAVLIFLIC